MDGLELGETAQRLFLVPRILGGNAPVVPVGGKFLEAGLQPFQFPVAQGRVLLPEDGRIVRKLLLPQTPFVREIILLQPAIDVLPVPPLPAIAMVTVIGNPYRMALPGG